MNRLMMTVACVCAMCAAQAEMKVDCDFPGGNVKVLGIDEAKNEIRVAPDRGDSSGWFWFHFRVTGAEGRTVRITFPGERLILGPLGPCVSADDGKTWKFLDEKGYPGTNAFTYAFAADAKAVRFAHGVPYTELHWNAFTAKFRDNPRVKFGSLCKSRRDGRDVDLVTVEPAPGVKPRYSFFFTCRHHCAEASASPVLEGLLEAALADTGTGRWMRENAVVYFVPFMDKDGVERGEQGKNRQPWDYNRDYLKERYPEVRAFKKLMAEKSKGTQVYYIDCHSPWIRGNEHEWFFSLGPIAPDRPELDRRWHDFRRALAAATKGGPLKYQPKWDIPGGVGYNVPKNLGGTDYPSSTRWCVTLPNLYCGFCMEFGYGLCGGVFSREKARALGRQTLQAIVESLKAESRPGFITVPSDLAPRVEAEVESVPGKHVSLLPKGTDWKLIWNDEFDQKEIDRTKWMCRENFWGYDFPAFAHGYEGVEMTGETVKLNLLRKGDDYTSPHLQTGSLTYDIPKEGKGFWPFGRRVKPTFMHRYGYWEIRCRLNKWGSWHSAFWIQAPGVGSHPDPAVAGTEVDIMESWMLRSESAVKPFGCGRGFIVGGVIAGGYGADSGGFGHFRWPHVETADGWHTYGCNWTPYGYEFYCDGVKVGEQNWPVSQVEEFMLVSTEPGGYRSVGNDGGLSANRKTREWGKPCGGLAEAAAAKDCFEVDYVRVYDNAAGYGDRPEPLPLVDVPAADPETASERAEELYLKVNRLTTLRPEDLAKEVSEADLLRMNAEALALDQCVLKPGHRHFWMKSVTVSCAKMVRALRAARPGEKACPPMAVLPVGSVRPEGWLRTQLELQAKGLSGHAEELYDDIGKSDWLTGAGVGGQFSWERGPYYAKGLVSLAFALDDAGLKAKAKRWVDAILSSQRATGDFGPKDRNWWADMIALWLLRDWCEATGDPRVVPFLEKYFAFQRTEFKAYPLAAESKWAVARAGDEMDVALWLFRRTGKAEWREFAKTLSAQSADWTTFYRRGGDPAGPNANGCRSHIVNFMQGLKTPALQYLLDGDERKRGAYAAAFDPDGWVMRMCGRPDRMINGSEPMIDRSASQGTELCAIAERIISCQTVIAATGDRTAADDLEIVAYNSLPATLGTDGKGCRYYCLLNQPSCEDKFLLFANNGDREQTVGAICPGPHAGFGCCRSNFHVAWPKFVQSMWMRKDGGFAAVAYGPARLVSEANGKRVEIVTETAYPFDGKVTLRIAAGDGRFPIFARIPGWCGLPDAGTFRRYERDWKRGDTIDLEFPMPIRTSFWERDAVAVSRGPLLFALKMESEERIVLRYKIPYENRWIEDGGGDFPRKEILPKSPWDYALALDGDKALPEAVLSGEGPGLQLKVKAFRTDFGGWGHMRDVTTGRAVDPPCSPIPREGRPLETVTLVPLCATQVRITLFPWSR